MTLEHELRQTSDSLLRALERMNDMESEKRQLPVGSQRFVELAEKIEDLAVEVLRRSEREASLAEGTQQRRRAGGGVGRPIETAPPGSREMSIFLQQWRDAERALAAADPATPESSAAASNVRRLREEYRMAYEAKEHRRE